MARIGDIVDVLESWAPISLAESWDNVGLLAGDLDDTVSSVIIALDITGRTLDAAESLEHPLIVSHHPLMLTPLSSLAGSGRAARLIRRVIAGGIGVYSAHTNLDRAPGGVSHVLAERLGLTGIVPLADRNVALYKFITFVPPSHTDAVRQAAGDAGAGIIGNYRQCSFTSAGTGTFIPTGAATPHTGKTDALSRETEDRLEMAVPETRLAAVVTAARTAHPYEEMAFDLIPLAQNDPMCGLGAIGTLPVPMSRDAFMTMVGQSLKLDALMVSEGGPGMIERVAVLGGGGKSSIPDAIAAGADAFITGDIGHHSFLDYGNAVMLIDGTHRATELPVLGTIRDRLTEIFPEITCTIVSGEAPAAVHQLT